MGRNRQIVVGAIFGMDDLEPGMGIAQKIVGIAKDRQ